jgi:hypothetical protein
MKELLTIYLVNLGEGCHDASYREKISGAKKVSRSNGGNFEKADT